MPPLTPPTLTRLDPTRPLLWRDDETLQFGLDGEVRIAVRSDWVEPLLLRLRAGFRRSAFDLIAHAVGAPRNEARELLRALEPLLRDDRPAPPAAWVESLNLADARAEARMRTALAEEGIRGGLRDDPHDVGVVLIQGAAAALQLAPYLRDDVPHLPVAFEADRVTVGPRVIPGLTPCLSCRDGHERDRDEAWPRMHAQLIGRSPGGPLTAARIGEAAALIARVIRMPPDDAKVGQITADGLLAWRSVRFHEGCRCREQSFRSPRGSEREPARLVRRHETTTETGFAQPA